MKAPPNQSGHVSVLKLQVIMNVVLIPLALALAFFAPPAAACENPEGVPGDVRFNADHDVFQGCTTGGWAEFHPPAPPSGDCETIGDICGDGTIYAGLSPDGNVKMYAAAADAPSTLVWGPGAGSTMDDCAPGPWAEDSCKTGEANTTVLAGLGTSYEAATYCADLSAHGHTDWYLPSVLEFQVMAALGPAPNHGFTDEDYYWTSTEVGDSHVFDGYVDGVDGTVSWDGKYLSLYVRCVRR